MLWERARTAGVAAPCARWTRRSRAWDPWCDREPAVTLAGMRMQLAAITTWCALAACSSGGGSSGSGTGGADGGGAAASGGSGAAAGTDGGSTTFGNEGVGLVHCADQSCDATQGVVCCLWLEGDPPLPKHGCVSDCAAVSAAPNPPSDEINCDGAEDCKGNACCDGKCGDASECAGGHGDWCHDSASCPAGRGCCTRLGNAWGGEYGLCIAPPDGGCT